MVLPYGVGARLAAWWWAQPVVQARALRELRRGHPHHPLYTESRSVERELLGRHFQCVYFRGWRQAAIGACSERAFARWTEVRGLENFRAAQSAGCGVVLAASHYGPSLMGKALLPHLGLDARYLAGGRERNRWPGANILWLGDSRDPLNYTRGMVEARKTLRDGGVVHIPADGFVGHKAVEIPFLGRRRRFTQGFAALALTSDAPVIPLFNSLRSDGRIAVEFHPALETLPRGRSRADRMEHLIRQYAAILQDRWVADPAQLMPKLMTRFQALPRDDETKCPRTA